MRQVVKSANTTNAANIVETVGGLRSASITNNVPGVENAEDLRSVNMIDGDGIVETVGGLRSVNTGGDAHSVESVEDLGSARIVYNVPIVRAARLLRATSVASFHLKAVLINIAEQPNTRETKPPSSFVSLASL